MSRSAVPDRACARRGNAPAVGNALRTMSFLPFLPPNVGGYPKGARLLGPHSLVHSFDLLQAVAAPPTRRESVDALFARFGVYDVSDQSRAVVAHEPDPATRLALVVTSPEYTLDMNVNAGSRASSRRRFITGLGVAAGAAVAAGYGLSVWADGNSSTTSTRGEATHSAHARRARRPHARGGRARRRQRRALHRRPDGRPRISETPADARRHRRRSRSTVRSVSTRSWPSLPLASRPDRSRSSKVSAIRSPASRTSRRSRTGGRAFRVRAATWVGSVATSTARSASRTRSRRSASGRCRRPRCSAPARSRRRSPTSPGSNPRCPRGPTRPTISWRHGRGSRRRRPIPTTLLGAGAAGDPPHRQGADRPERRSRERRCRRDRPGDDLGAAQGNYRRSASVADSLRLAAQLVAAKHAPRVIYVSGLGDYDTHQGQAQRHPLLMADLDEGVDAFFTTLDQAR